MQVDHFKAAWCRVTLNMRTLIVSFNTKKTNAMKATDISLKIVSFA